MGNFLKDQNNKIIIPGKKIKITIRPSDNVRDFNAIQQPIYNYLNNCWSQAGFELDFMQYTDHDRSNESIFQRQFDQPHTSSISQPSWRKLRTPYQQDGCYIDFNDTEVGSVYQTTFPESAFAKTSDYISIDREGRAGVLLADVIHEFGHALGLAHEHQRIDRDDFVDVHNLNQYPQDAHNGQQIQKDADFAPFGWYDVKSVMHYPGIFRLNNQPIGGTSQNHKFPDRPSYGDIMSARFLYNEARIKEYLEQISQEISPRQSNLHTEYSFLQPSREDLEQKQRKIQLLRQHNRIQEQRLQKLGDTSNTSFSATIKRTDKAVENQMKQLKELQLEIEQRDEELVDWSNQAYQNLMLAELDQEQKRNKNCVIL